MNTRQPNRRWARLASALVALVFATLLVPSVAANADDLIGTSVSTILIDCTTKEPLGTGSEREITVELGQQFCVRSTVTSDDGSIVTKGYARPRTFAEDGTPLGIGLLYGLTKGYAEITHLAQYGAATFSVRTYYFAESNTSYADAPSGPESTITVHVVKRSTAYWRFCSDSTFCTNLTTLDNDEYVFELSNSTKRYLLLEARTTPTGAARLGTSFFPPLVVTATARNLDTQQRFVFTITTTRSTVNLADVVKPGALPLGVYALNVASDGNNAVPAFSEDTILRFPDSMRFTMSATPSIALDNTYQKDAHTPITVSVKFTKKYANDSALPTSVAVYATRDFDSRGVLSYHGLPAAAVVQLTKGAGSFTYDLAPANLLADNREPFERVGDKVWFVTAASKLSDPTTYAQVTLKVKTSLSLKATSAQARIGTEPVCIQVSASNIDLYYPNPAVRLIIDGKDAGELPRPTENACGGNPNIPVNDAVFARVGALTPGKHTLSVKFTGGAVLLPTQTATIPITMLPHKRVKPTIKLVSKIKSTKKGVVIKVKVIGAYKFPGSKATPFVPKGKIWVHGAGLPQMKKISTRANGTKTTTMTFVVKQAPWGKRSFYVTYYGDDYFAPVTIKRKVKVKQW